MPRGRAKERRFLTPSEVVAFLNACDPEYRALFTTLVMTGMRLGEVLALKWADIDWGRRFIRVERSVYHGRFQSPKSHHSTRSIVLSSMLRGVLEQHRIECPHSADDLVFCTSLGTFIDGDNLRHRVFEPAVARAGVTPIVIHGLRHTYASMLISQGENLKFVQRQLGHASIQMTIDQYTHLMPDAHEGVGDRLDAQLGGLGEPPKASPVSG